MRDHSGETSAIHLQEYSRLRIGLKPIAQQLPKAVYLLKVAYY
jgi:hypothetical protein